MHPTRFHRSATAQACALRGALLPIALATLVACATDPTPTSSRSDHRDAAMQRLADADRNGDRLLSRDEAAALPRLAERFDRIDANGDGVISGEELATAARARGR